MEFVLILMSLFSINLIGIHCLGFHELLVIYIYIYIRWVKVTPGVTLKSYTFFKSLDFSKSNGKKMHLLMLIL